MKSKKLEAIIELAAKDLLALAADSETNILEAWSAAKEEAELEESKPKLKLGFSITLDLDKDHMETALTFGIKYKVSKDSEIPDPNQIKLPIEDDDKPEVIARQVPLDKAKN